MKRLMNAACIAALASMVAVGSAGAATITVTGANPNGWGFAQEVPTGTGAFVSGPSTAPAGTGSAQLVVNGTGRMLLGTLAFAGTRLEDITTLAYSSYRSSADPSNILAITLQLDIDYDLTDSNTAWQGRLVFEPYFTAGSGNVLQNTWQDWNALGGKWWASGAPGSNSFGQNSPATLASILALFPNAGIRAGNGAVSFKAGGPWSFDGNVDNFRIGVSGENTTFDFEPTSVPEPTTLVLLGLGLAAAGRKLRRR